MLLFPLKAEGAEHGAMAPPGGGTRKQVGDQQEDMRRRKRGGRHEEEEGGHEEAEDQMEALDSLWRPLQGDAEKLKAGQ